MMAESVEIVFHGSVEVKRDETKACVVKGRKFNFQERTWPFLYLLLRDFAIIVCKSSTEDRHS